MGGSERQKNVCQKAFEQKEKLNYFISYTMTTLNKHLPSCEQTLPQSFPKRTPFPLKMVTSFFPTGPVDLH